MVHPQRRTHRRASSSAASSSSEASSSDASSSESSHSSAAAANDHGAVPSAEAPTAVSATSAAVAATPRAWRFLDTDETCHFFNTEIVVSTNDVQQIDLDDMSDTSEVDASEHEEDEGHEPEAEVTVCEAPEVTTGDEGQRRSLLDPTHTTYEDIYSEFDDLYRPGITENAPKKMRERRAAQRQEAAHVLRSFSKDLQIGQTYLYQKRSEFLRVCFQRALDLNRDQDMKEQAESAAASSASSTGSVSRAQTAFRFQCSRLERPVDVTVPELHPRKWPHLPFRDPREWKGNMAAIVTFAQRVSELPEGSLLYEPIDVHAFTESCCVLLKDEGVDVWSTKSAGVEKPSEMAVATLVAMLSIAVRLQSFTLLLLVAELSIRVGTSTSIGTHRYGDALVAVTRGNMKTLQAFLQSHGPPATYPRALVSQWKVCAYQPSTSDAIATDGVFLYVYGRSGLLKVGTGRGSTMRDFVYGHNKSYRRSRDAERSWLCLIGKYLYCRSIVMPSNRVDRICTSDLHIVDELFFAPASEGSQQAISSSTVYAMVTDGVDLFTIHTVDTQKVHDKKKTRSSKMRKISSSDSSTAPTVKAIRRSPSEASDESSRAVRVGDRVLRGPDWKWGAQDGEKGSLGTVERISTWGGVKGCGVTVRWDKNQRVNTYRWGAEGCYDIVVVVEKPGGAIVKKPLPEKSPDSATSSEPIVPRHRFIVTRFGVSRLSSVLDLDPDVTDLFLGISSNTEAAETKPSEDSKMLLTAVHEHTLGMSSAVTAWMCDGGTSECLGDNSGTRYRCEQGCDFDLCEVCLASTLIGKQPDTHVLAPAAEGDVITDGAKPETTADKQQAPQSHGSTDDQASTAEHEDAQLDELFTFWCGLFSRRECEIALRRTHYSIEDAIGWLSTSGQELSKGLILQSTESFSLQSPPKSSGLDPVLLVAGSFYAIDGQLCVVSPPGLYQGERPKRSIHATDAAWFFSLNDGSLTVRNESPVLLKSVPAGSPVCVDHGRHRILVISGYLNCVEEYSVTNEASHERIVTALSDAEDLCAIGEQIYDFMHKASEQRWAWQAYKKPWQGLQDWISQLQQEGASATATYHRQNVKSDPTTAKARARRIKKLRLRSEEFKKLGCSGDRGFYIPYCMDFSNVGLRGLLKALGRATNDVIAFKSDAHLGLRRVGAVWRGFLGDCIASDVVIQPPGEWSRDIQAATNGLQKLVFGAASDEEGAFFQDPNALLNVLTCQDVLLWGIDVGVFDGLDRCDLLVECLNDLLADPSEPLPPNYFDLMLDSVGEVRLQSSRDCSIAFIRRVLALNAEAADGGIADLIYERSQVEELTRLLFKLSAREYSAKAAAQSRNVVGARSYTPVEKGLLALFNGCAIDLLARTDVPAGTTPRRRRLSSVVAEESIFHVFAITCLQACEDLVELENARNGENAEARLTESVCGKLLPLVLAMVCNGGRATLNLLKEPLLRLTKLVGMPPPKGSGRQPSRFVPTTRIVQSSHPYTRNQGALRKVVRIPGATCLHIEFDPRCSTSGEADFVFVTPGHAGLHSDRVPFGENGIGDAGGCFFGSCHNGNWPQSGKGISIWGDTATIMLCCTSQERQGTGADDDARRWGLKCVIRGVHLGSAAGWRSETLVATEHALSVLVERQFSLCYRTLDVPFLEKAAPLATLLRGLQSFVTPERARLVREIVATTDGENGSQGSSLVELFESSFQSQRRGHSVSARLPAWRKALRLALVVIVASVKSTDQEIVSHDSLGFQVILRTMSTIEQWMIRRVQLLKEWRFLRDDEAASSQVIEQLSTDVFRLKELCTWKDVDFFDSEPTRSAMELHRILSDERARGASSAAPDEHEDIANEIIEKALYALECATTAPQASPSQFGLDFELPNPAMLGYLTALVPAADVRSADECLAGALGYAVDAFQLVQLIQFGPDLRKPPSSATIGNLGSCWHEHSAERLRIAASQDSFSSPQRISAWRDKICQSVQESDLPSSVRVAAMTDFLAACAHLPAQVSTSSLHQYVEAVSDLLLDLEQVLDPTEPIEATQDDHLVKELAWIGYRYGIDALFAEGDLNGAVTALRELAGRLLSVRAVGALGMASPVRSNSLGRVLRIASAHVHNISRSPSAAGAWLELCASLVRSRDFDASMPVQIASLRTIFAMGRISDAALNPSITAVILDGPNLVSHLLERIGALQSSVNFTSDEAENKLKDCCVVILENAKSKSKIVDALEVVDCSAFNSVYLPTTLSRLDLSENPSLPLITSAEGADSGVVHRNVRCDGCNQNPVHGFRYKCFTCSNYDLCGNCYANQDMHSLDHQFVRLASASGAGELLQPRSSVNGAAVPEANLVGSKQWTASVLRALLDANGYGILCRGSSEDCLRRAKALSLAGFAVTVMEWPDVKDLEDFYDWDSIVQAALEPGSARLGRRSSSVSSSSASRKLDRSVLGHFNRKMSRLRRHHELMDPSALLSELVRLTRHLLHQNEIRSCIGPRVSEIIRAMKDLTTEVSLSTVSDRALFYRSLGLTHVLGGFAETVHLGSRVKLNHVDSENRSGIVKQYTDASGDVSVLWCSKNGLVDDSGVLETMHSPAHLEVIEEVEVMNIHPEMTTSTAFFPAFASVLKSAHKLLKSTPQELAQSPGHVAASELVVSWLRMFMASMNKLPSLLDSQASLGNGSGNMALLLFQLAKTSKSGSSFESLDASRRVVWRAQQVMNSDGQFKIATRPISSTEVQQDLSCVFGPGANGQTDLTDYVFNLYAHSARSELPQHSGRNKLLEYWEKNVIPAVESYVAGSFKSYEMDYFFAQLREPLREGNSAAAMKIAFTLCDGHVPSGCHYPDPDTDWTALQLDEIEIGARYLITDDSKGSNRTDWPLEMRWTVGHSGVARTICPNGLVLLQVMNPNTSCLEHWWFQVENLTTCNAAACFPQRSVDAYESALSDLVKLDLELLGVIARKCVFSILRASPEQFPLVSDRQATKNHFNIVDILRIAAGAELGFEAKTIVGESDIGRCSPTTEDPSSAMATYDLLESLRYVLTKRFEDVPVVADDAAPGEQRIVFPVDQAHKAKLYKSGKTPSAPSTSPMKTSQEQQVAPSSGLAVVKYRYTLIDALAQELKRSLESSAMFSQQNAFMVASDSPPKSMLMLKVPGASCLVISFAVHPVLMDLPAGSSLEFFRDERCSSRIFGYFGEKRGLNYLPPLVVQGDKCFVRASQASYARYKFRVDPLTSDFGLAMWIGDEVYQRMMSVTLSGFELESIVSSTLNSITDYLVNGVASLPPCVKGVVCQLLTKLINFAINRSMSNSVPLSKLSALTRDLAVAYDHELSAQKGLFSLPTQQLGELLATVEEVSRVRGVSSIDLTTQWWPHLVRFAAFTRALSLKREPGTSTGVFTRSSCGRMPTDAIDEASRMLQERDLLCERMILLQRVPRTKKVTELEIALSRYIQHHALEECGEADDQTVLSATEVVRLGVLGKVLHLPVDINGETVGYAVVDVGRHDIVPRLLLRLQKHKFEFDGSPTEEDSELASKLHGLGEAEPHDTERDEGDDARAPSVDNVWSCGVCTLENPASEVECAACGSPIPVDAMNTTGRRQRQSTRGRHSTVGSHNDQGATGSSIPSTGDESSSGWHCEACTLVNPWATSECGACGSERNPSLVEPAQPSARDSEEAPSDATAGSNSVLHCIQGHSLSEIFKLSTSQHVHQLDTFLREQFTVHGNELNCQLSRLVAKDIASARTRISSDGDSFSLKATKFCGIDDPSTLGEKAICAAVMDVATREPTKIFEWLRGSGYDLNVEPNHYPSIEAARANQANWTHQMDVQLVALARQVGSRIGVLSLMDLCPSHLCASHAPEGSALSALESRDLRLRFVLLKTLNEITLDVLPMVNLRNLTDPNAFRTRLVALRQLLFPAVKIRFFAETQDHANLAQSNLMDANAKRPVVTLDRRRIAGSRQPGEPLSLRDPKKSLFAATMAQLSQVKPSILRAKRPTGASDPFVAFIVVFSGENVVGEGGPYRQLFNDIATELLMDGTPLFIPTPNSVMKIGDYRDRFLPNPRSSTRAMLKMYEFVGVLMGCCIRTGVRLNVRLAPIVWKMLVRQSLLTVDLEHIDFSVSESLKFIEAAASQDSADPSDVYFDSFTTALSDGTTVELKPGGSNEPVTKSNCKEYVSLAKAARFRECKPQVDAILRGIGTIVPIHLLQLCTWLELQQWVCGSLAVDVELLKRHTLYSSGMTPDKFPHLDMFWRVLGSFSEENKRRFINFAWGQDTLPADDAEFDRTHTRLLIKAPPVTTANQDSLLPKADTCFFNIELPAYSSEDVLREKLMLAITMCTSMDGDEQTGRMDLYFSSDALDDDHME